MAREEGAPASAVLLVLCGLPAAGKTSFARQLAERSSAAGADGMDVHHVCFDALAEAESATFDVLAWRRARSKASETVEALLAARRKEALTRPVRRLVVVIDDNMHLRSMRRQYMRLAQKCGHKRGAGCTTRRCTHNTRRRVGVYATPL